MLPSLDENWEAPKTWANSCSNTNALNLSLPARIETLFVMLLIGGHQDSLSSHATKFDFRDTRLPMLRRFRRFT